MTEVVKNRPHPVLVRSILIQRNDEGPEWAEVIVKVDTGMFESKIATLKMAKGVTKTISPCTVIPVGGKLTIESSVGIQYQIFEEPYTEQFHNLLGTVSSGSFGFQFNEETGHVDPRPPTTSVPSSGSRVTIGAVEEEQKKPNPRIRGVIERMEEE